MCNSLLSFRASPSASALLAGCLCLRRFARLTTALLWLADIMMCGPDWPVPTIHKCLNEMGISIDEMMREGRYLEEVY